MLEQPRIPRTIHVADTAKGAHLYAADKPCQPVSKRVFAVGRQVDFLKPGDVARDKPQHPRNIGRGAVIEGHDTGRGQQAGAVVGVHKNVLEQMRAIYVDEIELLPRDEKGGKLDAGWALQQPVGKANSSPLVDRALMRVYGRMVPALSQDLGRSSRPQTNLERALCRGNQPLQNEQIVGGGCGWMHARILRRQET